MFSFFSKNPINRWAQYAHLGLIAYATYNLATDPERQCECSFSLIAHTLTLLNLEIAKRRIHIPREMEHMPQGIKESLMEAAHTGVCAAAILLSTIQFVSNSLTPAFLFLSNFMFYSSQGEVQRRPIPAVNSEQATITAAAA